MERLLDDDVKTLHAMYDEIHNAYLKSIVSRYGFDPNSAEFRKQIQKFLHDYETQIRDDYVATADE
ncbi:MAG TPA: hypothetical protein PK765_07305 [bacterium]|nr:hypothetical protein [bacterium]